MRHLSTDAVILHTFDYRETSRIVRLATREIGVVSAMAKGARRAKNPFGSAIDLFTQGVAHLVITPGREMHTLAGFDAVRTRPELAHSLSAFGAAAAIAELTLRFAPGEDGGRIFSALSATLDAIAVVDRQEIAATALAGAWRLMAEIGFSPALESCASCQADLAPDDTVTFHHRAGGALCRACAAQIPGGRRLPPEARHAIVTWLGGGSTHVLDPGAWRAHQRLLREFIEEHVGDGRPLRAFAAWEALPAAPGAGTTAAR
jgi:DNA repair protein RecO (recombination protein O)